MHELLQDIKGEKIDIVLVYKIDRLTRSPKDFYQLIEFFEKYKVNFISITERFDTSTSAGRLLRNIMLTFAQFERELASEGIRCLRRLKSERRTVVLRLMGIRKKIRNLLSILKRLKL